MVLDAAPNGAKGGIEEQTRKLFEVCRLRDVPIITFVKARPREPRPVRPGDDDPKIASFLRHIQG